ncbi:MAG: hypothetical protein PHC66_03695 [Candidatus Nanoarchaeia archaeon]|nr:hypothetical protein [Candidatus Nanoarchaeia archaeon]
MVEKVIREEDVMEAKLDPDRLGFLEAAEGLIKLVGLCAQRRMRLPFEHITTLYQNLKENYNI